MSDQFLNLEGRDTFNADNGYEKVKIVNGGIPQNSDLNEQSSIDEERARNIMKEGFGSGKRHKDDFTIHLDTGELLLKVRESEAGVIGTLWQDGNRLKLLSASDITIADNDTTPVYRKLKSTGYFRGRVYLVHAKQDYIDPNAKLTVRDINSTNLIQVDTAVREKRVVDYYIDWSVDGVTELPLSSDPARIDCSINGNGSVDPVVLDDTHAFSGKTTFVDSPLYGFTGYLYYLGDIVQVDGGQQTVDPEKSELFNGNSDNVLYTGGDTAHRRDTEIAGLVSTTGIDPIELEGLKLKVGGTETDPIDVELAGDPNVTFHVSLAKLSITATEADEQLHMPSLSNAYHILEDDLTSVELFNQVLEKNSLTLATFFQTAFAGHAQDMAEELLSEYLILYVDGDSLSSLDDVTSEKILQI